MRRGKEVVEEGERGIGKEKNRVKNKKEEGKGRRGKQERGKGEVPACRKGQKAAFAAPAS